MVLAQLGSVGGDGKVKMGVLLLHMTEASQTSSRVDSTAYVSIRQTSIYRSLDYGTQLLCNNEVAAYLTQDLVFFTGLVFGS